VSRGTLVGGHSSVLIVVAFKLYALVMCDSQRCNYEYVVCGM